MYSIWDIHGVPVHRDWARVHEVPPAAPPQAYDEDAAEAEAEAKAAERRAAAVARRPRAAARWQEAVEDQQRERRERALVAEQVMATEVRTARPDTTVGDAWEQMTRERIRHLPVLNAEDRLVGILSDRDLLRVAGTPDRHPLRPVRDRPVREIMRTRVVSARPDASIRDLARLMVESRIGCVPIIDDALELVGIVTRGEVLRTLVHDAPMDLWI